MIIRSCPKCGKYMEAHTAYSKLKNPKLIFHCKQCGYSTDKDEAGLVYSNILDRYKLLAQNEERK